MKKKASNSVENTTVNGAKICGAKLKKGGICHGKAMPNGRCRFHGGKTPIGPLNPHYKHGRYSQYVPENIRAMYEESIANPQQLELGDEVGILDGRIADRLLALQNGEAANATWKGLEVIWKNFMFAVRSANQEEQQRLLVELNNFITKGSAQASIWYEIASLIESRRKLVDSESKRMETRQNIITVEQAFGLVSKTITVLKEVVYRHADPQIARAILIDASVEHQRIIGPGKDSE